MVYKFMILWCICLWLSHNIKIGSCVSVCKYYPSYPSTAIIRNYTCDTYCCTDIAKSMTEVCCDSKLSTNTSFLVSIIVIFVVLTIVVVGVIVYFGCFHSKNKTRRTEIRFRMGNRISNASLLTVQTFVEPDFPPTYKDLFSVKNKTINCVNNEVGLPNYNENNENNNQELNEIEDENEDELRGITPPPSYRAHQARTSIVPITQQDSISDTIFL